MNLPEYRQMYAVEDSHWWYVGLHRYLLTTLTKELSNRVGPVRILDAGCGTGRLSQLMTNLGAVDSIDASAEAIRFCRERGIQAEYADLNSYQPEVGVYDAITSIDVLYHTGITDDVAVLKKLYDALKPGGILLLNLVAFEFLRSTHDIAVHTRERYTSAILAERLAAAGFSPEFISYRVSFLFPFIAIYRLLARIFTRQHDSATVASDVSLPSPFSNKVLLAVMSLENRILRMTPIPFGTSLFAIARKPQTEHHHA